MSLLVIGILKGEFPNVSFNKSLVGMDAIMSLEMAGFIKGPFTEITLICFPINMIAFMCL